MQKSQADRIIKNYVKPLYGFAVNKMYDFAQAEELASAIVLEVYQVLLKQDNIANINSYIFKIAHNVWVRFIDEKYKIGLCELSEHISDNSDFVGELEDTEMTGMLRREIAYLSETQRKILVAYYFKDQKVREISSRLEIPENTVKWHLSCARKELKIGMDKISTSLLICTSRLSITINPPPAI